ncbi:hypothetical protein CBS101457_000952 [Exobasidium rhododendri]|nr:hypothetical protein CBS101457_000952 [Exobasidium rhododendri]
MLLARSLPALIIPRLALSVASSTTVPLRSFVTVSTLSYSTSNLGSLGAPPLAFYTSSFINSSSSQSIRKMGSDSSKATGDGASFPKGKSDTEWRTVLSPAQFKVLRQNGTEPAFTSEFDKHYKEGVYNCAACDTPLYTSGTKFKSGCGWPAFFDAIPGAVTRKTDRAFGMKRVEVRCAACDSHLGHVFEGEGFNNPTDERHCVNGICLRFNEDKEAAGGKM